jgi:hypothetical protein
MPLNSFNFTGSVSLIGTNTTQNIVLPTAGTPTTVVVTNLGSAVGYVLLGATNAVTVSPSTGIPVLPGQSVVLTQTPNLYIAAIGQGAIFNVAVGT